MSNFQILFTVGKMSIGKQKHAHNLACTTHNHFLPRLCWQIKSEPRQKKRSPSHPRNLYQVRHLLPCSSSRLVWNWVSRRFVRFIDQQLLSGVCWFTFSGSNSWIVCMCVCCIKCWNRNLSQRCSHETKVATSFQRQRRDATLGWRAETTKNRVPLVCVGVRNTVSVARYTYYTLL